MWLKYVCYLYEASGWFIQNCGQLRRKLAYGFEGLFGKLTALYLWWRIKLQVESIQKGQQGNCGASIRKGFLMFWWQKIFYTSMFQSRSFCILSIFKRNTGPSLLENTIEIPYCYDSGQIYVAPSNPWI